MNYSARENQVFYYASGPEDANAVIRWGDRKNSMRDMRILGVLAIGIALGAVVDQQIVRQNDWTYWYVSETNHERNIVVLRDGSAEIGPHYDRATEARKLIGLAQQMLRDGVPPACHETGYEYLDHGERRVYSGPAPWPPNFPYFEWKS